MFVGGALICLGVPIASQEPIQSYEWPDGVTDIDFVEDDLDGDGHGEILVGHSAIEHMGNLLAGRVDLISSRTGTAIRTYYGSNTGTFLGHKVAYLGDVNGDGVGDFGAVGNGGSGGEVWVWSGADRSALFHDPGPSAFIARLGDTNGDGLEDFALESHVPPWGGVEVRLGGSFTVAYLVQPPLPAPGLAVACFGCSIERIDDVNGDGRSEFAVSAPWDAVFGGSFENGVYVFSGADGAPLFEVPGGINTKFGRDLAAPGDLNADGVGDLIASGTLPTVACSTFAPQGILVGVYDGRTGSRLGAVCADAPAHTLGIGLETENVGDADGDGIGDLLVTVGNLALPGLNREVWLIDGATRELIYELVSVPARPNNDVAFANSLGVVGDWNADDFPDFLLAHSPIFAPGRIDVYSGAPRGVHSFGTACPTSSGLLPRIGATGSPALGASYEINLSRVEPGRQALLALGFSNTTWQGLSLPFDLAPASMPGCELLVSLETLFPAITTTVSPGEGAATIEIDIPADLSLSQAILYAQWFVMNPRGSTTPGATTRGLGLTLP